MNEAIEQVAKEALELRIEADRINRRLEWKKEELRKFADGDKLQVEISGLGVINVTQPRIGTQKIELNINEDKLAKIPELRQKLIDLGIAKETVVVVVDKYKLEESVVLKRKLIEKGIVQEEIKMVSAAKAAVQIKLNV